MNRDEFYIALEENKAYLEHHGIHGQKWGLRRYQNPDGTLTPAGRERYLKAQRDFNRIGYNEKRSVVGSGLKSAALSGVGTFALNTALGVPAPAAAPFAGIIGGAAGALTMGANAFANAVDSSKLKKAQKILDQYKEMYGDQPVSSVTKNPKLEQLIDMGIDFNLDYQKRLKERNLDPADVQTIYVKSV